MDIANWLTHTVRVLVFGCVSVLATANVAVAGIEDLQIYPWDLDQGLRCYASDSLESSRPPTTYASPLETIANQARLDLSLRESELSVALAALNAAESAARPTLNPSVTYTAAERTDDFETYLAVVFASLALADAKLAYLEDRLVGLDAALAKPSVSFGDLFSDQGDEVLALYFTGLAEDGGDTVWGLGDPAGFAIEQLGTFVTGDILDALARDYRPDLVARIAQAQVNSDTLQDIYDNALVEYLDLVAGGIALTLFAPPSRQAVEALAAAQAVYDQALALSAAAATAYYAAFDAAVSTQPSEPVCDSRELGVALQEFCALPLPVIDPADEEFPGQSDYEAGLITSICGIVADALPGVEITSDGGDSSAGLTIDENRTDITTVSATQNGFSNLPASTLVFSIVGGADRALFDIDPDTGALVFLSGHSFESPEDADQNNTYLVDVSVSDVLGSSDAQSLTIAIIDLQGIADPNDPENVLFTQRVIANFMGRRAHQITSNDPDLAGRLGRAGNAGEPRATTPVSITGSSGQGFSRMAFSANLTAMAVSAEAAKKSDYEEWRKGQFSERNKATVSKDTARVDVWAQGIMAHSDNRSSKSSVGLYYLGADYLVKPDLVVGILAQADLTDEDDRRLGTSVKGKGWMAGPYVAGRLHKNIVYDARAAWGQSTNDVDPFGLYTDQFDTNRQLLRARITGNLAAGRWTISPQIGVIHFAETQKAYTDSLGNRIPDQDVSLGRVSFGPTIGTRVPVSDKLAVEPYAKVTGFWDFEQADIVDPASGMAYSTEKMRARTEAGMAFVFTKGWRLTTDVFYDGIGVTDYESYGGRIGVSKSY